MLITPIRLFCNGARFASMHHQVGDVMNRLTVAMPTPRDSRTREASIPESVVAAKAAAAASSSAGGDDDNADGDAPMGQVRCNVYSQRVASRLAAQRDHCVGLYRSASSSSLRCLILVACSVQCARLYSCAH
jgi:hypothetical protein